MFRLSSKKRIKQFYEKTQDKYSDWISSILENNKFDSMLLST